jgi:hypothetical protein
MDGDRERVIKAEVIATAWKDVQYKERLKNQPRAVLTEAGIDVPKGVNVNVLENCPNQVYVVLQRAEIFEQTRDRFLKSLNWMLPLPPGVRLDMVQDTATDRYMVIPQAPDISHMSDEQVLTAAGGVGVNVNNAVNVNEGANVNVGGNVNAGVNVNVGVDVAVVAIVAT